MGVVEDVREVIQELVTPDLKALSARIESLDKTLTARIDAMDQKFEFLDEKIDVKLNAISAKIDSNHATVINAQNIDKRLEALERVDRDQRREPASAAS